MNISNLELLQSISTMALGSCVLLSRNKTEKGVFALFHFVNISFMFAELAAQWEVIKISPSFFSAICVLTVLILISANAFVLFRVARMPRQKETDEKASVSSGNVRKETSDGCREN